MTMMRQSIAVLNIIKEKSESKSQLNKVDYSKLTGCIKYYQRKI